MQCSFGGCRCRTSFSAVVLAQLWLLCGSFLAVPRSRPQVKEEWPTTIRDVSSPQRVLSFAELSSVRMAILENSDESREAVQEELECRENTLQGQPTAQSLRSTTTAHAERRISPTYYLHIPKCGSSFATTLAHSTCGESIAPDVKVTEPHSFFKSKEGSACSLDKFARFCSGHRPLGPSVNLASVVVIMRNPLQRIMSGYYAYPTALHDCPALRERYHCQKHGRCDGDYKVNGVWLRNTSVIPPLEYATCVENCAARMLTGSSCGSTGPVDEALALRNIRKIGFVGLTEDWALSVCLWHTKYGGDILPVEFANVRKGTFPHPQGYNVSEDFGDWQPSLDMQVYRAAVDRFSAELKEYDVTRKSCARRYSTVRQAFDDSVVFLQS